MELEKIIAQVTEQVIAQMNGENLPEITVSPDEVAGRFGAFAFKSGYDVGEDARGLCAGQEIPRGCFVRDAIPRTCRR